MAIKNSETIRDIVVENSILEAYNLQRGIAPVYYSYVKIDLNSDSVPEYFVYAYGPMLSGSGGGATPATAIMKFDGKTYPSNPLLQPTLGIHDYVDGVKIFTENISKNLSNFFQIVKVVKNSHHTVSKMF